jgi:hypothetical protein
MSYMLKRSAAFARFLDDGRICLFNTAAERVIKCPVHKATKLETRRAKKTGGMQGKQSASQTRRLQLSAPSDATTDT